MGQYRSDYISLYKNKTIPEEISKAQEDGKKIIIFLGHHSPNHWFDSYLDTITSWSAQISFLKDVIRCGNIGISNREGDDVFPFGALFGNHPTDFHEQIRL